MKDLADIYITNSRPRKESNLLDLVNSRTLDSNQTNKQKRLFPLQLV